MMISSKRTRSPWRGIFIVASVLLLIMGATFARGPLTSFFWSLAGPLMEWRFAVGEGVLRGELAAAEARLADRDFLYAENLELKARLGRPRLPQGRVLAGVVSRPPATPYDTLVIDAGTEEGVAVGDEVSAGGGVVVGTVSDAYEHSARVMLFSAPGSVYEALLVLSGSAGGTVPLTVEGQGGGSLRAQVPAGTAVAVGDAAVLPGIAGGLSARVSSIEHAESESYITLYFRLPADTLNMRFVEVLKR